MNNKVEINSDKKIQEIKDNLIGIHDIILKKVILSKDLKFKKINNSSQNLNLNKNLNSIMNRPLNLMIRFYRFVKSYFFTIISIFFILFLTKIIIIYFYQFEILLFLIRNNIDTLLISNIIVIMNETIQFIKNIYFNILNMINLIDFNK